MSEEKLLNDSLEEVVAPEEAEAEPTEEEEDASEVEEAEDNFDGEFEENEEEEPEEKKAVAQSAEENAKYAQQRREAEAKAKQTDKELKDILKPYNVSSYDELSQILEIDIDDKTKKRLQDEAYDKGVDEDDYIERYILKEEIKLAKAKERARIAEESNKKALNAKIASDIAEFKKEFPNIDPYKLMEDERFMDYGDGKLGKKDILTVYKGYRKFIGESKEAKEAYYQKKASKSTITANTSARTTLSSEQQKAFDQWNERYPHNKFKSVAEYLKN